MSCGKGHKQGSDPALLWPATTAQIQPLAWELPYAMGAVLKRQKGKKKKNQKLIRNLGSLFKFCFLGGGGGKGKYLQYLGPSIFIIDCVALKSSENV